MKDAVLGCGLRTFLALQQAHAIPMLPLDAWQEQQPATAGLSLPVDVCRSGCGQVLASTGKTCLGCGVSAL